MIWRMRAESWERINPKWWSSENRTEKTTELLRMVEKNSHNQKQLWEHRIKLAPRIFKRMDMIAEKLFFGLQMLRMMTRTTTKNCLDTPGWRIERLSQRWKEFDRSWRKYIWLMIIHSYDNFEMNLRITPKKLVESDKILGKDLWVRARSKDTPLNDLKDRLRRFN